MPDTTTTEKPPDKTTETKPAPMDFLAQTMKDLGHVIEQAAPPETDKKEEPPPIVETPPAKEEPKKEEAKKEEPKKEEAPPAAKVVPQDTKALDTIKQQLDRIINDAQRQRTTVEEPPKKEEPKPQVDEFESTLDDLEKEELELRRFAERTNPDKYKDSSKQYVDSLKRLNAYIEKARKENPERTFDENDDEFKDYVKENIPNFSMAERRSLERKMIAEEAREQAKKDLQVEQEEIKRKQRVLEVRPEIERGISQFSDAVNTVMAQPLAEGATSVIQPIIERAKEVGWKKALDEDPIHAPIVKNVQDAAVRRASEYLALVEQVKDFRPYAQELPLDHPKNDHVWLLNFIRRQGEWLDKNGGDMRVRVEEDGTQKTFVPMHVYGELTHKNPEEARNHWTFTPHDVLDMLAHNARVEAETMVKKDIERMEAAGYQRVKKEEKKSEVPKQETTTKKPAAEPKESGSPKATSSVAPGAGTPPPSNNQGAFSKEELKALGFGA